MKTSRPVVLVARGLPAAGRDRLAAELEVIEGGLDATAARVRELAPGAAAIVVDPAVAVGEQLLEVAGPALRIVANFGVGHDHVDLDACRRRGVFVTNTPGVLTDATAELALALTLAAARRLTDAAAAVQEGRWTVLDPGAHLGVELTGSCVGIVGMGRIGYRYAELVRPLAKEIVYASRSPSIVAERELGAARLEFDGLLERADVVSLHLPATAGGEPIIGRQELARMTPTAILVNTARGRSSMRRRSHRRCAGARSRQRVSTSTSTSPGCRVSCSRRRTASCFHTSVRPLLVLATRWPGWSPPTCSPPSVARSP